jgi:[CysO sulfur-carrier protein]-S-L-cysteine hydrolase
MSDVLIIPRRLAIALLAEAQKAAGAPVQGLIGARDGVPVSVLPGADSAPAGQTVWAHYRSGGAAPAAATRALLISIDTKGVLQLRCEEGARERELRIL